MTARLLLAAILIVIAAGIAYTLDRRRRSAAPLQSRANVPQQLDRADFPQPATPWLVVLWSSRTCESCHGLFEKLEPLASADVAVAEVEYQVQPDLHKRYSIDAAPVTVIVDHEGVTRGSFVGAFSAPEVWAKLAEVRAETHPS
jgi:thioredoxin-like negative regulator of GroEL